MTELPKAYDPLKVEAKWYRVWLEQGYFHAGVVAAAATLIALRARTVDGLGQQVDVSLQDALVFANENAVGMVDLMGNRLQVMMTDLASSQQLIREGKVRALGVTTKARADVKTMIQQWAALKAGAGAR